MMQWHFKDSCLLTVLHCKDWLLPLIYSTVKLLYLYPIISLSQGSPSLVHYQAVVYLQLAHASGGPICTHVQLNSCERAAGMHMHAQLNLRSICMSMYTGLPLTSQALCIHTHRPATCMDRFPSPFPSWVTKLQRLETAALSCLR